MWQAYTPEVTNPPELSLARQRCAEIFAQQPAIKNALVSRDVAHMAATALGYVNWGLEPDQRKCGLGDLGGWPLDLLQIWGSYRRQASGSDLAAWLHPRLGSTADGAGFGYDDVLADVDAWLIARHMTTSSGPNSLSGAMRDAFAQSQTHRIQRFYRERFSANTNTVTSAFQNLADGIDVGVVKNIWPSDVLLRGAAHADQLPKPSEAGTLARAYAAFIATPHR